MKRVSNTVALAERWAKLTGVPVVEASLRVRVLRLAGLLPDSRSERRDLTEAEIATFILAAMASETHLNAPLVVKKYAKLRPMPGSVIANPLSLEISRMTLVDGLALILRRMREGVPQIGVTLTVGNGETEASLTIAQGDSVSALAYGAPANDTDGGPWPLQRDVTIPGPVLGRMAGLLGAEAA